MKTNLTLFLFFLGVSFNVCQSQTNIQIKQEDLKTPQINNGWVQPTQNVEAQPVWGFKNGIRVGIAPMGGPRGLIRIYTPYLKHEDYVVTNFIAFEPIDKEKGIRGISELEFSDLDQVHGKRFWSGNTAIPPQNPDQYYPAEGVIDKQDGKETLTVYIFCEKFHNGADVYVRLRFTEGKPYQFEITGFASGSSVELKEFILTATMGNKTRLRTLHLAGNKTKASHELWPDYRDSNFTPHAFTSCTEMISDKKGAKYFIATTDEENPENATYAADTHGHWKYKGDKAVQFWYCDKYEPDMQGIVNGRYTYWASKSPIPGGISFENFEIMQSFKQGQSYIFGISPLTLSAFIDEIE